MKVIVLGGGASGVLAALKASEHSDVTIIEGNNKIGKKLLITGAGRCNFWNKDLSIEKYYSANLEFLERVLTKKDDVFNYLTNTLGIYPTNKDGYIYPYSKTASSVVSTLERELEKRNIEVIYNLKVQEIKPLGDSVEIYLSDNTKISADKVIIALGGSSASKTGSDGSGYKIIQKLGIAINPTSPSLVPLISSDKEIKPWSGVRTNAKISVYKNDKIEASETGEIQLTENGISGIVTFNISSLISEYLLTSKEFSLTIDFLPEENNLKDMLNNKNRLSKANTVEELLESIFHYKLMSVLLKRADIKKEENWNNLTLEEQDQLVNTIKNFKLNIIDTDTFEKSQVTRGGVPLTEITSSFKLKKYNNISVVGELLDVDGICGGYNLAFAFISGYIAGDEINDSN